MQSVRVVCRAKAKHVLWFPAAIGIIGVEGELTHIQEFVQLSDNVGMFYPLNKSVPSIEPH